jgi:predicted metal-dependent phosphoesterase TrpH
MIWSNIINRIETLAKAGKPMPVDIVVEAAEQGFDAEAIYDHIRVDEEEDMVEH